MKVTSVREPQSSCPFRTVRQKVYGLGYSFLIFVYDKIDDSETHTGRLDIRHVIFVEENRTADLQLTKGLIDIMNNEGNTDNLIAFMNDKLLPGGDI